MQRPFSSLVVALPQTRPRPCACGPRHLRVCVIEDELDVRVKFGLDFSGQRCAVRGKKQ
jgi:hypothetical protein